MLKIRSFLAYLLFFPSINFKLISAEIFPWPILYFLTYKTRVTKKGIIITSIILINIIYGISYHGNFSFEIIRSLFAYLNVILIFSLILNYKETQLDFLLSKGKIVFYFLIILAISQIIGLTNNGIFQFLIDNLMQRGSVTSLGGERGITLLSTEPSRASGEFIFIYILVRYFYLDNRKLFLYDLIVFIILIFGIKSATGLFYYAVFLMFAYKNKLLTVLIYGFLLLFITIILLSIYPNFFIDKFENIRAITVLISLINSDNISSIIEKLFDISGFRLISVYSSYIFGFSSIFGGGLGFWEISSVQAMTNSGIDASNINYFLWRNDGEYSAVRSTSFAASLFLDFGLMAIPIIYLLFKKIFVTYTNVAKIRAPIILFFIYIFFYGTIGNPIPWIVIGLLIRTSNLGLLEKYGKS